MPRERVSNRREFLLLAHVFEPAKHTSLGGWLMSDKLDGQRAFWDGGITRGLYAWQVPFTNTSKDGIRLNPPKCTGLWSRYAKPIQAPLWWLDQMPRFPMDGELYIGPQRFQDTMSACRKLTPVDSEWEKVKYHAFDLPDYSQVFADGEIRVPNFEKKIEGVIEWLRLQKICKWESRIRRFETVSFLLEREFGHGEHPVVRNVPQEQLPFQTAKALERIRERLQQVTEAGGEGLMLRNPISVWEPQRTHKLLKVKPWLDCEVKVRGYVWGRETDLGSKLLGMMGAMIVDYKGRRLELSGFTDAERVMEALLDEDATPQMRQDAAYDAGVANSGQEVDVMRFTNPKFKPGSLVTIRYREETKDGIPKEARFWR